MPGKTTKIEILIMAAGASRRLGQSKQFIQYKGKTLIRRIAEEAITANIGNATIVTGFDHDKIEEEVRDLNIGIYYNEEWEEGLGSSIRNGVKALLKTEPDTDAILLTMVDQPFVDSAHLRKLANAYDPLREMIIASAYSSTFGVPVLFDSKYFDEMIGLEGDEGGKKVLAKYIKQIVEIPFIAGAIDIDEKTDLNKLE
jgi:molybdenum cofactor cytidylyltransferase